MNPYDSMALLYDEFMEDVPYEQWAHRIIEVLNRQGIRQGRILELACGTGKLTEFLLEAGYFVTGVDRSEEMLVHANNTLGMYGQRLKLVCEDMVEYKSSELFHAVVCVCDGINYIDSTEQLSKLFQNIAQMCYPGAVFIFDVSTEYKFKNILADRTIAESNDDNAFIWLNSYDQNTKILEFDFTLFIKEGNLYKRYTEHHIQHAYSLEELKQAALQGGFQFEGCYNEYEDTPFNAESERMHLIFKLGGNK